MKNKNAAPSRAPGRALRLACTLLLLVPAALGASGCAGGHPNREARIKNMNRVIEEGGYQSPGRPANDERFRQETQGLRK